MIGLPEVISIRLTALHLHNGEVHTVPYVVRSRSGVHRMVVEALLTILSYSGVTSDLSTQRLSRQ
jgi:hypothetical protein